MSVSDLAEYAYCPRAYWYRHHPPAEGPSAMSGEARARGERYHTRTLASRAGWERRTGVIWWLLAVGALLCVLAWLLGSGL